MESERRIATIVFADVSGLPASSAAAASEADERLASIVCADVSGFTALSERLDPEDVRELMNRCFTRLERGARDQGGWVAQYLGDCIVAVFDGERADALVEERKGAGLRASAD